MRSSRDRFTDDSDYEHTSTLISDDEEKNVFLACLSAASLVYDELNDAINSYDHSTMHRSFECQSARAAFH